MTGCVLGVVLAVGFALEGQERAGADLVGHCVGLGAPQALRSVGFGSLPTQRMFELFDENGNGIVEYVLPEPCVLCLPAPPLMCGVVLRCSAGTRSFLWG